MVCPVRLLLISTLALPLWAQQSTPPAASSSQSSSSNDNAVQSQSQDQPPSSESSDQNTKHESKVKQQLKDLAPQCVGIEGGSGKCRHSQPNTAATKREDQERQLHQQCSDSANQNQQPCVELRKQDSAHDTSVGDDYLSAKHYPSAVSRYRLALQEDPTNTTAMLHLAQALNKSGNKAAACEQFQQYQQQKPEAEDSKDRDIIHHLQHDCSK